MNLEERSSSPKPREEAVVVWSRVVAILHVTLKKDKTMGSAMKAGLKTSKTELI